MTLEQTNLLWLRGRVAGGQRRSLSDALDELVTAARLGGRAVDAVRSVVGTIDIAGEDPLLDRADAFIASEFQQSLARPVLVRDDRPAYRARRPAGRATPGKARRG